MIDPSKPLTTNLRILTPDQYLAIPEYRASFQVYESMPIAEVHEWAKKCKVEYLGESEKTFRFRVLMGLQLKIADDLGYQPFKKTWNNINLNRVALMEAKARAEAGHPELVNKPKKRKEETPTAVIRRLCAENKTVEEIRAVLMLHPKFSHRPRDAKNYVLRFINQAIKRGQNPWPDGRDTSVGKGRRLK